MRQNPQTSDPLFVPRATCVKCLRPETVCVCGSVERIETKTRVIVLQHPRETDVGINTVRIAAQALANSEVRVGIAFPENPDWLTPDRPVGLLYPGTDAIDITSEPPEGPVTLVVIDGTWSQARSLVNRNPWLKALPRFAFTPRAPSAYQIRREPKPDYVSTIEALAHVLSVLERDETLEARLLRPFHAMVAAQVAYATTHESKRHTSKRRDGRERSEPALKLPYIVRARPQDLVCITAEANGWPLASPNYDRHELIQWTAERIATGEVFDAILAPRRALCPATMEHAQLGAEAIEAGLALDVFFKRWRAFLKLSDVLCHWGPYAQGLFDDAQTECQVEVPPALPTVDLRAAMRAKFGKFGTMSEGCTRLGQSAPAAKAQGRAGARLAELASITRALLVAARR
jgi:DTW domain-containing protein